MEKKVAILFQDIVDHIFDLTLLTDLQGNITAIGKGYAILGDDPNLLHGKNVIEFVHSDDVTVVQAALSILGSQQQSSQKIEYRCCGADGNYLWLETIVSLFRETAGDKWQFQFFSRDISDWKKGRLQLYHLSRLVEQTSDSIIRMDSAFKITYMNRAAEILTGFLLKEAQGRRPRIFSARPDDDRFHDGIFAEILQSKQIIMEFVNRRKNAEEYIVKASISPLYDEQGVLEGFVEFLQDITERKRIEAALTESEERFEQCARQSRSVVWEVNATGLYTSVSSVAEEVFGYCPEEIVGHMHFYDLHPDEGKEEFKSEAFGVFQRQEAFNNFENRVQTKSGPIIWVTTSGFPILNADGSLQGYRGSDLDITERKISETVLRESEARYRALTMQSHDAVVLFDKETLEIVEANPRFEEMTGYLTSAKRSLNAFELFDDSQSSMLRLLDQLCAEERLLPAIRKIRTQTGQRLLVERTGSLVKVSGRSYLLIMLRDVTEEMERQREMNKDIVLAAQVQRALLPAVPMAAAFRIETLFSPKGFASGDVYHLEWKNDENILRGLLVDISGHGLAAALQTAAVNVLLHEVMDSSLTMSVSEQLAWLNQKIPAYLDEGSFAAAIAFELDFSAGEIRYAAAGITEFLLNDTRILAPGLYLGIYENESYEMQKISFTPGDTVCFMTDGITDILRVGPGGETVHAKNICELFRPGGRYADKMRDDATAVCIAITENCTEKLDMSRA
ncbi:MAG: PAS domain S-box protein [Negativicutes bacterium]